MSTIVMENDKSTSEAGEIEQKDDDDIIFLGTSMGNRDNMMSQILTTVRAIQRESLGQFGRNNNNSIADTKIEREAGPSNKLCWNVEDVEGHLEFGDAGLVTAKGPFGLIRALHPLPHKERGIVYFELKLVDIPKGCDLLIGISQMMMMVMSSFHVFRYGYKFKLPKDDNCQGLVIGCGIKYSAGKMFIIMNGKVKECMELEKLECGHSVDQKLTVKLRGEGCAVQLGRIEMSDDEGKCLF